MSHILKVSQDDYRVKVQDSGTITLDTGVNTGVVRITGNLVVDGDYTTVNTTNLEVEDNIILLNKGETGNGVTEGFSGIQIQRSLNSANVSYPDAQIVWNESIDKFVVRTADGVLTGIVVGNIATQAGSNLVFDMQNSGSVLRVANTTGYELLVSDPNDIPNKQYVLNYVSATGGVAVVSRIFYSSAPNQTDYNYAKTEVQCNLSNVEFLVRDNLNVLQQKGQFTINGFDIDSTLRLSGQTITNTAGSNLILTSSNTHVEVSGVFNLDDIVSAPGTQAGTTRLYSQSNLTSLSQTPGRTGLFFKNSVSTDELVAKNRALLFSMLF